MIRGEYETSVNEIQCGHSSIQRYLSICVVVNGKYDPKIDS
jgi:hypothetical protein